MEKKFFFKTMKYYLRLKKLPRNGWIFRGIDKPDTIASHSFGVTLIILLIIDEFEGINREKLLKMAIIHDLGESIITDIPKETMDFLTKSMKEKAEEKAIRRVLGNYDELQQLIVEYNKGETLEAKILFAADKLEMLIQALEYYSNGYSGAAEFFENLEYLTDLNLPVINDLVQGIKLEFEQIRQGKNFING